MLTSGQLLKLRMVPIAIQSRSNRAPTAPAVPLLLAPPATHLPPPTPRHQQPSATFTLQAPLLPSHCNLHPAAFFDHLKEPHPKRPAQATLFLPSNLLAPSHTSPWNSNPYDLFYPSIPSVFPLFFHGFTRFLHHFTLRSSLPKCTSEDGPGGNRTPPSPNCHLVHQPQNRSPRPPQLGGEVPQECPCFQPPPPSLTSFAMSNFAILMLPASQTEELRFQTR